MKSERRAVTIFLVVAIVILFVSGINNLRKDRIAETLYVIKEKDILQENGIYYIECDGKKLELPKALATRIMSGKKYKITYKWQALKKKGKIIRMIAT